MTTYFLTVAILIGIALYIIVAQRNLIKLTMGISMLASTINLFLIVLGYPALTLASIIIVAVLALMLTLIVRIYRHTGSIDSKESRLMKG